MSENNEVKKSKLVQYEIQTMHTQSTCAPITSSDEEWRLEPRRYSSCTKLVRVYAWVFHFVENCKRAKDAWTDGQLNVNEIRDEDVKLIVTAQKSHYSEQFSALIKNRPLSTNSKMIKMNPKNDSEGVLRSEGRLKYADMLSYDCRYPIICA